MKNCFFITGTSSGIGKALAEEILRSEGNEVFGYSRRCTIEHERYHHLKVNLGNKDELLAIEFPKAEEGVSYHLVNNAASLGKLAYNGDLEDEELVEGYLLNIVAPAVLTNRFIQHYRNSPGSSIINISSGAASKPYDGWSLYCTAKAGINMLTQVTNKELALRGNANIRVYAIAPGVVATPMQAELRAADEEHFSTKQRFIDLLNNDELYPPEKVAKMLYSIMIGDKEAELIDRL